MIAFIQGTVEAFGTDWIIINHDGMGFRLFYAHPESISLHQEMRVYTYMNVREDEISLFGFVDQQELEMFNHLIKVKGLGPKTAMNMLARHSYADIISSIEQGNLAFLKGIPGIGSKTASQILLDLKGKLVTEKEEEHFSSDIQDAMDALKNLGYKTGEINIAAKRMNEQSGLSSDQYLKIGLQFLMKRRIGG